MCTPYPQFGKKNLANANVNYFIYLLFLPSQVVSSQHHFNKLKRGLQTRQCL